MATILKNVVQFAGLAVGVPVALPHGLNVNGTSVVPDFVAPSAVGFTITVNATNVTVTRTASAPSGSVNVYVERWHSIEDVIPPGGLAGLLPFVTAGGSADAGAFLLETPIVNQDIAPFIPGQPITMLGARATTAGPNFQVVGLVKTGAAVGLTASLVAAGPLTLTTAQWDAVTGGVGGLIPNALYYVAPGPAGFLTALSPTAGSGDSAKIVGIALNTTTMAVMCSGPRPLEVNDDNVPFATALEMNFGSGLVLSSGGSVVNVEAAAAAGRFDPVVGVNVPVTSQTGHFTSPGVYVGVGIYTIHLNVIPGLTTANQIIPTASPLAGTPRMISVSPGFTVDHATVGVRVHNDAGALVDDSFYLHVDLLI